MTTQTGVSGSVEVHVYSYCAGAKDDDGLLSGD